MTAAIGADADIQVIRLNLFGFRHENVTKVIQIGGTSDDAGIEQFLTDYDRVSNAGVALASVSAERLVTGMEATPESEDATSQVNNQLVLSFFQDNPLNPTKTVTKSVQIPAPNGAVLTAEPLLIASVVGDRSTRDENLRGLVNYLRDNLVYIDAAGDVHVGGWTFDLAHSGYIASPAVIDGL